MPEEVEKHLPLGRQEESRKSCEVEKLRRTMMMLIIIIIIIIINNFQKKHPSPMH